VSGRALSWVDHRLKVKVSRSERAVLRDHASRANEFWASWAATPGIAKRTQYAERTVENCERALVKKKLLIPVPWVTNYGRETSSGYFLAGVFEDFDQLPDVEVAFKERIEFRDRKTGALVGGRPRDFIPDWWSGRGRGAEGSQDETPGSELRGPKNSALRGPMGGTPITTISNHQRKELPDAADAASTVDADASTSCAAAASRDARDDQAAPRKPKRRQSLATYLKTLGTDAINEMYWDFEETKKDLLKNYANPRAREELGVPVGTWPDEHDDALTLKAVEIVIHTLRKRSYSEFGEVVEGYLDGFDWPPTRDMPETAGGTADAPLRYRHSPGFLGCQEGQEDAALANIHAAIDRMPAVEIAESLRLFDAHRPDILKDCRAAAAGTVPWGSNHGPDRQVLHIAADFWRNKPQARWPRFVVPIELHPKR
jgi:hypothetical protein